LILEQEEIYWRQRAKERWAVEGDQNTKYFHRMATAHKRFNSIDSLEVDGSTIFDSGVIKEAIQKVYKKFYMELTTGGLTFSSMRLQSSPIKCRFGYKKNLRRKKYRNASDSVAWRQHMVLKVCQ